MPDTGTRRRLAAGLALLAVALADGVLAMRGALVPFDEAGLQAMAGGPVWLRLALTHAGDPATRIVAALAGAAFLLWRGRPAHALRLAGAITIGLAAGQLLKDIVGRPRPALLPHLDHVTSASWPSGHAMNGTITWVMLALTIPPPRWRRPALLAALALAAAIGLSRVSLAVHWPSDVIAGWAIGGAIVLALAGSSPAALRSGRRGRLA